MSENTSSKPGPREAMARLLFVVYAVINLFRLIDILPGILHSATTADLRDTMVLMGLSILLVLPLAWFVVLRWKPWLGRYLLLRVGVGVLPLLFTLGGVMFMPHDYFFAPALLETLLVMGMLLPRPEPTPGSVGLVVVASVIVVVCCVMFSSPPEAVYRVQSCLWRVGSDLKWRHPQGLAPDVTFDQALRAQLPKGIWAGEHVRADGLPNFMPGKVYHLEREGTCYSWEGRRVLCWHRVLTFKGYCHVLLLDDWKVRVVWHADVTEKTSAQLRDDLRPIRKSPAR